MKSGLKFFMTVVWWAFVLMTSCNKNGHLKPRMGLVSLAGNDQVVSFPADSVNLDGSASDDEGGSISKYQWTKIYGPDPQLIIYDAISGKWSLSSHISPLSWEASIITANDQIYIAGWEGVWRMQF